MMKKFHMTKGNLLRIIVTSGVMLGNIALMTSCPLGIYEPTKPEILKSEK